MDKNANKKYAVWARRELISRVSQRAAYFEITEAGFGDPAADSVLGRVLSAEEKTQRQALIAQIRQKGYQQVMEEVAYTWFNRFIALRFMEVNGYLPSHVRVFTDEDNQFKPQILAEAIHIELDGLDMQKVYAFKNANDDDGLFKYIVIVQCNALSSILPGMFQRISDYTELLFPDNLLRDGSVLQQMIEMIPEEDWKDAVQIIGWLYQYYNAEKKDEVFAALKKNVKITKENIPAATQLFTPDWIVRYMVENSLGRLWLEHLAATGEGYHYSYGEHNAATYINADKVKALKANWKYYLEEAEQEPDVQDQLAEIRKEYAAMTPEQIKCIDPCCGSGHILAYLFDVLMQIYESYGYTTREAVASIVQNNLYGLDIDDRAAQLAYFAVMMKARQYDRRFFSRGIQPHVYAIQNSKPMPAESWGYLSEEKGIAHRLWDSFADAKEYGSLVQPEVALEELDRLKARLVQMDERSGDGSLFTMTLTQTALDVLCPLMELAQMLVQKYDVVVTNPPYMSSSGMGAKLAGFVKKNYPDSKSDLFSTFMERADTFVKENRFTSLITMESWMFLSSFEKIRKKINQTKTIINMVHMPYLGKGGTSLGINFGTAAVIMKKGYVPDYNAQYEYTVYYECDTEGVPFTFPTKNERWKIAKQSDFSKIPGSPVAYWVSDSLYRLFDGDSIGNHYDVKAGICTGKNERFIMQWHEVDFLKSSLVTKKFLYTPHNKGGEFRKWYGNRDVFLKYNETALTEMESNAGFRHDGREYYFKPHIGWSKITSSKSSFRFFEEGFTFDSAGLGLFSKGANVLGTLALLNSKVVEYLIPVLNPTMNVTPIIVKELPYNNINVDDLAQKCIFMSRNDWDAFETSWNFSVHPLIMFSRNLRDSTAIGAAMQYYYGGHPRASSPLEICWLLWKGQANQQFRKLKANEEELNRIFIDTYGLQDELTPEVADKDVTVHYLVDTKDDIPASLQGSNYVLTRRDVIVSLISYVVGCMFGRYSLDVEGLAYAGGDWNAVYRIQQEIYAVEGKEVHLADGRVLTVKPAGYNQIKTDDGWKNLSYPVDADNVIPICDDEYFDDDMVDRFVKFIETVYGSDTLEENLKFIADALGGKGTPRDVIRSYFLNDFYADHCKTYQKRPIYWLFDSGKKNGFKALIYMHRYQPDIIARIRTAYVHEQQSRYRTAIADLESRIASASTAERVKLNKQLKKLQEQDAELRTYEEKIHHLADKMTPIDLDDGVKVNYAKFQDVLAKIK